MAHPDSDDLVIQPNRNNPALSTCLEQLRLQSGSFSPPATRPTREPFRRQSCARAAWCTNRGDELVLLGAFRNEEMKLGRSL